jgi:hypothetical protein
VSWCPKVDRSNTSSFAGAGTHPTHLSQAAAVTNDRATLWIFNQRLLQVSVRFMGQQLENAASEHRRLNN